MKVHTVTVSPVVRLLSLTTIAAFGHPSADIVADEQGNILFGDWLAGFLH